MNSPLRRLLWVLACSVAIALPGHGASGDGQAPAPGGDAVTDVVIVGAGGAGFAAAIEATRAGARVILVEKSPQIGGNTRWANGMNTSGATDPEDFYESVLAGGHHLNDKALVRVLADRSADAVKWLRDLGVAGAESAAGEGESSGSAQPIGIRLVSAFEKIVPELGLDVRLQTRVVEVLAGAGRITGVVVEPAGGRPYRIGAKAVILATGGFGANRKLAAQYDPRLEGFNSTNDAGATGDAFGLVKKFKVALVDMKYIQTHPTVPVGKRQPITEGVRGAGAILLNREARRFVDETGPRDRVSEAILKQQGRTAYLVFDRRLLARYGFFNAYRTEGVLIEGESIAALAGRLQLDPDVTQRTLATYNAGVAAKADREFGRRRFARDVSQPPFFAIEVAPAIHYTMGGLKINPRAEVLDEDGKAVKGLYAAGEVTGGVHGANRLGGNAITDIIVFGRIAGVSAAESIR